MYRFAFIAILALASTAANAATEKQYALVDASGNVVNVIVWDGVTPYTPPDGLDLVKSDKATMGGTYDKKEKSFARKPDPVIEEEVKP